jgi:hypothetical protein
MMTNSIDARVRRALAAFATSVAFVTVAAAQEQPMASSLVGLPDHNLTLSGDPVRPTVSSTDSRRVILCSVRFELQRGGHPYTITRTESALLNIRNGAFLGKGTGYYVIPPGGTFEIAMEGEPGDMLNRASLDAAMFEDGEFVGPDLADNFGQTVAEIEGRRDLHKSLFQGTDAGGRVREATWSAIGTIAVRKERSQADFGGFAGRVGAKYAEIQESFAQELLRVRARAPDGDASALRLAAACEAYPTPRRSK